MVFDLGRVGATKAVRREVFFEQCWFFYRKDAKAQSFFSARLGHEDEKARRFFLSNVLDV
jgi:hypothetical protein